MDEQFWMVWRFQGDLPTNQHPTFKSAECEAERLARNNPGARFYVFQARAYVERTDVRRVQLETPPPF